MCMQPESKVLPCNITLSTYKAVGLEYVALSCQLDVRPYKAVRSGHLVSIHCELTVRPYRAVRPGPVILQCVRLRLQRLVKRARDGSALSVMPTLWVRDNEVREGMVDRTAAPVSVTRPPQISRDSSF